jgi:hypothetical protein
MTGNEQQLDQFNQQLRSNPRYQQYLRSIGVNTVVAPGQPWRLNDNQRKQAASWVRSNVGDIGKLEIDPSGNANQNEGFGKQLKKWGPIAGGVALSLFGIPGVMPGLLSSGAPAAAAAGTGTAAGTAAGTVAPAVAGTAAGTAATTAAAAAGPFSGLSSWGTLGLINAGANAVSGVMGARASGKASEQQIAAGDRALAFEREQYEDTRANLTPWMTAGRRSLDTLSSALTPVSSFGQAPTAAAPRGGGNGLVTVRAPNGQTKQVSQRLAQHYASMPGVQVMG